MSGELNGAQGQPTSKSIEEEVRKLIVKQLDAKPTDVTLDASFTDDLGADSLDLVELVMAMEEHFDIEIPDEDAESIVTVESALRFIEQHLTQK